MAKRTCDRRLRTVRREVSSVLLGAGYEVVEASDGVEGAEQINANADAAMVICDVNMPRMNGIEMLSFLKKEPKHVPSRSSC